MPARKHEDNFYTRAQYQELVRSKFPPVKVFEADDGTEFFIPHPKVADDDIQDAVVAADSGRDIARAYLGDQYAAFVEAGGQSWMVGYHIEELAKREQGTTPDGTPTT